MEKTTWIKTKDVKREWYIIDAKDKVLGKLATKVASLLIGKGKVSQSNGVDGGDYVIVVNAKDIKLTRGKETKKMYYSHTMHPGGFKEIRFDKLIEKNPVAPVTKAIEKMLPKNKLRPGMLKRLFVYGDSEHKQEAQQPKAINL